MEFICKENELVCKRQGETLVVEAWGKDSLRVRSTMNRTFTERNWALTEKVEATKPLIKTYSVPEKTGDGTFENTWASITNGRIKAEVNYAGVISFYRDDKLFLREYYRAYGGTISKESRCIKVVNREWKGLYGSDNFALKVRFESNAGEKIFGMGQYQQQQMDLKGCTLELAQRNSQISVPFAEKDVQLLH